MCVCIVSLMREREREEEAAAADESRVSLFPGASARCACFLI